MIRRNSIWALLFVPLFSTAQQPDTVLTYSEYLEIVLNHHPRVLQAGLRPAQGEALVMQASGNFDPTLESDLKQKSFNGKEYYTLFNAGLKVPTWYGVSFNGGFDQTGGEYLDPSRSLPQEGMWYAGVELELGKGMLIDKRRAELQKAKLYQWSNEMERRSILATLRLDAATAYWDWSKAYGEFINNRKLMENAEIRLRAVKDMAEFGDRPEIDTLEASIQYANRLLEFERTSLELLIKRQKMELFLWVDGEIPLEAEGQLPEPIESLQKNDLLPVPDPDAAALAHPYFSYLEAGLARNRVEIKLQEEMLKPKVSLKYQNLLAHNGQKFGYNHALGNHILGASFSYAIPARTARASLALARLDMQEAQYGMTDARRKIANEILIAQNTLSALLEQISIAESNVRNQERLYLAEQTLFVGGESSLFMINAREASLLSARYKLIELQWKYQLAQENLRFAVMPDQQP